MRPLRRLLTRLGNFVMRRRNDERLKEEIEAHLALQTEENIKAGLPPAEARRQAMMKFGAVEATKEDYRAEQGLPFIESLMQDVRFGLRMLRKSPGFTLIAVITLSLGIGANTAIFSVVDGVLLRPLPYKDANRLVVFMLPPMRQPISGPGYTLLGWRWLPWVNHTHAIEFPTAYQTGTVNFSDGRGLPERIHVAEVSKNFASLFNISPRVGRFFNEDRAGNGDNHLAEISCGFWRERYAASPAVLGKTIQLGAQPYTIAAVLPCDFDFPSGTQVWIPFPMRESAEVFTGMEFSAPQIARLAPGASLAQARAELQAIEQATAPPGTPPSASLVELESLRSQVVGSTRGPVLLLMAAVGLVLLIACADVSHLLLARGPSRFQEMALRSALGATRGRLVRQLLTECLLVSAVGGGLGLLLGWQGIALARALAPLPAVLSRGITLDASVLGFSLAVTIASAMLSGVLPALAVSRLALGGAIRSDSPGPLAGNRSPSAGRLRDLLGVTEIALACLLATGTLLLVHSFWKLVHVDPGFDSAHVLTTEVALAGPEYQKPEQRLAFYRNVLSRTRALPGVRQAGFASAVPLGGQGLIELAFAWEGESPGALHSPERSGAMFLPCSSGYFRALGIPLVAGRDFRSLDNAFGARPVAIVSRSAAQKFWPGKNPIGRRLRIAYSKGTPYEVVGVVSDVRQFGLSQKSPAAVYVPLSQEPIDDAVLVVRTAGDPLATASAVREVFKEVDSGEAVSMFETMRQLISLSLAQPRFRTILLGIFAGLAVVLAVLGVFSVMSHSVSERVREIGIRMALGAEPREISSMVLQKAAWLSGIGAVLGLAGAFALSRLLASLLYGVSPLDPVSFILAPVLLAAVALAACYVPARRAMRVDPMTALRNE